MSRRLLVAGLLALVLVTGASARAGLRFKERMPGYMTPGVDDYSRTAESRRAEVIARISTDDVDAFFADPIHPMRLEGKFVITWPDGTRARYTIEDGVFLLLRPGDMPRVYHLVYRFRFGSASGRSYYFDGAKTVRDDPGFDVIRDTTLMYARIRRGGPQGPTIASGKLRFEIEKPLNTARFVSSFRVPRAGFFKKFRVIRRFLKLFLGRLAEVFL